MTVAQFLATTDRLKAMGMRAMFSADIKPLMTEMKGAATSYRAEASAARAAGRTDLGCPPAEGKLGVNSNQIMTEFAASPPPSARARPPKRRSMR